MAKDFFGRDCKIIERGKHDGKEIVRDSDKMWCSSAVKAENFPTVKSYYEQSRMEIYSRMSKI